MRYIKSYTNDAAIQAAVDDKSLGKPYVALDENTGKIDWNGKNIDYASMYLTIEALEDGTLNVVNTSVQYYSINSSSWESITGTTALSLNQGDKVRFKGKGYTKNYCFQDNTIKMNVYGNFMSVVEGDDFADKNTPVEAQKFFYNCSGLTDASNLILPTVFRPNGISEMFSGCKSLVAAPELLAENGAYIRLFENCSSLNFIKCLATNVSGGFYRWVRNVPSTGTFVKKAGVTWPTGNSGIPSGWTVIEE